MKQKTNFFKRLFVSKIFLIFEILILGLIFWSLNNEIFREKNFRKEISKIKEEKSVLEKEKEKYLSNIDYLQTQSFLEKEAREKLFLQKKEEKVFLVLKSEEEKEKLKKEEDGKKENGILAKFKKWWYSLTNNESRIMNHE